MKPKSDKCTPVFLELRPEKTLLDSKFDGYKLSLDKCPSHTIDLGTALDHVRGTEDQYSLQHVKLFTNHNHLLLDKWNPNVLFFVDNSWNICSASINSQTGKFNAIAKSWKFPTTEFHQQQGRFNVTCSFPNESNAIVADGVGNLFLLETGSRSDDDTKDWKIEWREEMPKTNDGNFVILDSSFCDQKDTKSIDIVLLLVDEKTKWKEFIDARPNLSNDSLRHPFVSVIEWLTLTKDGNNSWSKKSNRTLIGSTGIDYLSLESENSAMYIASDNRYYFTHDSENPIKLPEIEESTNTEYLWSQDDNELKFYFRLPDDATKEDVSVDVQISTLSVKFRNILSFEGNLAHPINVTCSKWDVKTRESLPGTDEQNGTFVEILLPKEEKCLTWTNEMILGNSTGQEILDEASLNEIHNRLAHLTSDKLVNDPDKSKVYDPQELEECDEFPAQSSSLMRIDRKLQCITHQISLGSYQWLFNVCADATKAQAICVRSDVDGLIWQPEVLLSKDEDKKSEWKCRHIGTFLAPGYVQASKQQRKFTVSSPDLSYVAICDVKKHVYLYRQPGLITNELRNRKTGELVSHIAKQQIISIDPPSEIMGAVASNDFLYILTSEHLHAIRIKEPEEVY